MTRTDGLPRATELKFAPTHTARSLEMLSRRLEAFDGSIGSGKPCDEPDLYLVDGHTASGAEMWESARRNPTVSVPRPPVDVRFVSADPAWGPRLAEVRQEAVLRHLQANVSDIKRNLPVFATPRRGGRKQKDVDALLGKVESKIVAAMKRQRATETDIQNTLYARLYSQHSAGLAKIIKDELKISISERTIRRTSRKYAAWERHRMPAVAPSIDTDVGPAYSRDDGEEAARSATGQTVSVSVADAARESVLDGKLQETKRGSRGCRTAKSVDERQLEKAADDFFRAAGLNPADFQAD